jgi:hypothetical protein
MDGALVKNPPAQHLVDGCVTAALRIRFDRNVPDGLMGSNAYGLTFTNVSETACAVRGWPKLSLAVGGKLGRLPITYGSGGGPSVGIEGLRTILLRPGQSATSDVVIGNSPASGGVGCATPAWRVRVSAGSSAALVSATAAKEGTPFVCVNTGYIDGTQFFPGDHLRTGDFQD